MSETNANTTLPNTMKPLGLFSDRATDYVKYRPSYPAAAIDTILEGLGDPSQLTAADVGAGTGIASRMLAERGVCVSAIEPNAAMRQAADPHPLVDFFDATAEASNLPEASVDVLTSFQAFHWFNPIPTLSEFRRILKPSGRLALVWNDQAADDQFSIDFNRLILKAGSNIGRTGKARGAVDRLLSSSPHFVNIRCHTFTHRRELDLFGTIGYALSKSFAPREGSAHQQLISDLKELHARSCDERGFITLVYCTTVYLADPQLHDLSRFCKPLESPFLSRWRRLY